MSSQGPNIEVAQSFFEDCADLLIRFDKTWPRFFSLKSRRFKCFHDLRSAYECILKSIIAYHQPVAADRFDVVRAAERHNHRISDLEAVAGPFCTSSKIVILGLGDLLDRLPVGLRYTLDGFDFLAAREDLYYETIGSDPWMLELRATVRRTYDDMNRCLSAHSRIVDVSDILLESFSADEYNKYRK